MHANKQLLIDVDDLSIRQGDETILDTISICIHAGEFLGIIGPNGAGKTTLLRALLGLLRNHEGSIVKKAASTISYIPQHGSLYNNTVPMSVLEVVKLGSAGSTTIAREALQAVRLEDSMRKRFAELSGGQRQRVAIAKALASNPDILILDEPTTGIDERSQAEFYNTLDSLRQKGITIILVAHELDTVLHHASRIVCLNRKLLYDGPPELFDAAVHMPEFAKTQHHHLHPEGGEHA
ncbi:MAG TPA: metal ABC transporter ATP-binding protein [Candidatus Saccharimonadales bacterium]|nr:metal ABC transporter ATP-binding protein [Candidatus Saccharimonadales bacterium]